MHAHLFRITLLFILLLPQVGQGQDLSQGLLLHYPLDGNATDISGNGFDGTVVGAVPAADRFGNAAGAMQFDGNAYIEFPLAGALKPELPITLNLWVWFDELPADGRIMLTTDFLPNAFFGVTLGLDNANRLLVSLGGVLAINTFTGSTPLSTGRWHHIVVVIRAEDDASFFLNGCEDPASQAGPIPVIAYSPLGPGSLGRANAGTPPLVQTLRGRLDDLRYWSRPLNQDEANELYDQFYTPTIALGPDTMICTNETLVLEPQTTVRSWTWNDGSMGPTLEVAETGKYWVSAQTDDCQEISDTINVMVAYCDNCEPATPNAFTPNGDGQNDTFRLLFDPVKCRITDARIMIFNRWGKKVFESSDIAERWDGRLSGQDLPSDVYIVVVRYAYEAGPDGQRIVRELQRDVALLR